MTVTNPWGQEIKVGDVVGWGRRDGNMSSHSIGVVLEFKPYTRPHSEYVDGVWTRIGDITKYKVKCRWVSGREYTSTTEVNDVFLLDETTLNDDLNVSIAEVRKGLS